MEIAMMVSVEILVGMSNFIIGCCAAKTGPCTQLPQHLTIRKGVVIKKELCLEPFCKNQFTVSPDSIAYRLWRGSVNTTIMIRRELIYEKKNR